MEAALAHFQEHLWLYLSIPVISGIVGWGTNALAIKMMFHPLEFVGIKPIFGWQGIVPASAPRMADIAVDLVLGKLITMEELFGRLDPDKIAEQLREPLLDMTDELVEDVMSEHQADLWAVLPTTIRERIKKRVADEMPDQVAALLDDVRKNVDQVFDVKDMVVNNLARDKHLVVRLVTDIAADELTFIARSGLYFGFLFGLVQMVVWTFYKDFWVLPAFGLLVGYATNWLALRMIFEPQEAKQIGPWKVQGMMHKRQQEIAGDYGKLVADEILTPNNITEAVLRGPLSDRLFKLVERHVKRAVDDTAGIARPLLAMSIGTRTYIAMKESAVDKLTERLPETTEHFQDYAYEAMGVRDILAKRMQQLTPDEFENVLRPAFKQDEWKLIAVGAALGFGVGVFQFMVMFADVI